MSTRAKIKLAGWFVVALTAWPLVQMTLVYTHDISPWKLAGWGMYSAPQKNPDLLIVVAEAGGQPLYMNQPDPSLVDPINEFITARVDLGPTRRPDALASRIFDVYPQFDQVLIEFYEIRVDRKTAVMDRQVTRYPYHRPGTRRPGAAP